MPHPSIDPSEPTLVRIGLSPWTHMNPECFPKSTGCEAGVELDILELILSMMNVRIQLVTTTNTVGCGGRQSLNGTWNGLYKLLHAGQIDMIGNLCNLNKLAQYDSQNEFDVSWPVWQYRDQFIIQAPKPPHVSFAPWVPFHVYVWLACISMWALYLIFSFLSSHTCTILPTQTPKFSSLPPNFFPLSWTRIPAELSWPFRLFIAFIFIIYNTYILTAVLCPFPVWRPFSNSQDLADQLSQGKYRALSYKNPPSIPTDCMGKPCESKFRNATLDHGFEYVPNGTGYQILSRIAHQDPQSKTKLVLVNGMPFVNLYLTEFFKERDRLWIIDSEAVSDLWVGFVWRKNFSLGRDLRFRLRQMGDSRLQVLSRYVNPYGVKPYTGDYISEPVSEHLPISLDRFRGTFYMLMCGMLCAWMVFLVESTWCRLLNRGRYMFTSK